MGLGALLVLGACSPGPSDDGPKSPGATNHLTYPYFTDGPDEQTSRSLTKDFEQQTGSTVDLQIFPFSELASSSRLGSPRTTRRTSPSRARGEVHRVHELAGCAATESQF